MKTTGSGPFNPNFPTRSSFPAVGTVDWLVQTLCGGSKDLSIATQFANEVNAGAEHKWQTAWGEIYARYDYAKNCRANSWPSIGGQTPLLMEPGEWVETLLDQHRFWDDVNGWALECVEQEFKIINPDGPHLYVFASVADGAKMCEKLCVRFHAYQKARYRYHQHLLEKRCERALGGSVLLEYFCI